MGICGRKDFNNERKKSNTDTTNKEQNTTNLSSHRNNREGKNKIQNTQKADINYSNLDMTSSSIDEDNPNEKAYLKNFENSVNKEKNKIIKRKSIMYDAIFKCESINTLYKKGWSYFLTKKFKKRIKNKEYKICPICFLGEINTGKTFILNLLTNKNLKSGNEYKTEGISCKFSNFKCSNYGIDDSDEPEKFLLFDTAGRSGPLLIEPDEKLKIKDDLKGIVEKNYRDLRVSEEFLENVLINNSQIIIFVVNQLTLAEQIFLYELKNQQNFDQLFIIHNLFNFEKKEDLEDYIDNTIVRSIYFDMSKDYFFPKDYNNNNNLPYYFVEYKDNNGRKSLINHFILGNTETKDPWIRNLNKETIEFLKDFMLVSVADSELDIREILEKQLNEESKIGKETKLEDKPDENEIIKETILEDLSEKYIKKGIFKLDKEDEEIIEDKRMNNFYDFVGSRFYVQEYIPNYIFYKNNENTEFVIEVECSGLEDKDFSIKARKFRGKVHFHTSGKKIFPKELNMEDMPFSIYFFVNVDEESIDIETGEEIDKKKPIYQKGIYKKIYKMSKNQYNYSY